MKRSTSLNNGFSVIVGAFLLIEGVWGLTSDVIFGILTTNRIHAGIHIGLGILGIIFGIRQNARGFNMSLGLLLLMVGALRFVPGTDSVLVDLLNVNENVAYLNILIGAAALGISSQKIVDEDLLYPTSVPESKPAAKGHRPHRIKSNPISVAPEKTTTRHPQPVNKKEPANKKEPVHHTTKKTTPTKETASTKDPASSKATKVEAQIKDVTTKHPVAKKNNGKKTSRRKGKPVTGEKS